MNRILKLVWLTGIALMFLSACSDEQDKNAIYLCGNKKGGKAFYCVNGEEHPLSNDCQKSHVNAMAVIDGNVYCAGYVIKDDNDNRTAMLWINGKPLRLTDGRHSAYVNDVFVKDNIAHCVGEIYDGTLFQQLSFSRKHKTANYWKINLASNEISAYQLSDSNFDGKAQGVYVDDKNIVHIVGADHIQLDYKIWGGVDDSHAKSRHWQISGNKTTTVEPFYYMGVATAVAPMKEGVRVLGYSDDDDSSAGGERAIYTDGEWSKHLPNNIQVFIQNGTFVENNWYACGYKERGNTKCAVYYKNGQPIPIYEKDKEIPSIAYAIDVVNEDIYICGKESEKAGYWRNNKFIPVNNISGNIVDIKVIPPIKQ